MWKMAGVKKNSGNIRKKYFKIGFLLIIIAVTVLAALAILRTDEEQEKAPEINSINNSNNLYSQTAVPNNTSDTPVGPATIPLEKPPFID